MAETSSPGAIPVVLQGLGPIGQAIARAALATPDLEVVGAVDPAHDGVPLADVLGPGAPDVEITGDPAKAFAAAKGGVVLHATSSLLSEVLPQIERAVAAGLHVVSTCEELAYPWLSDEEAAERLHERCVDRGVAVVAVGVNPGFVLDRLPALLSHVTGPVRHVRALRVVDAAARREGLRRKVGIGFTPEAFAEAAEREEIGHIGLAESAHLLAEGCGFQLDHVEGDDEVELVIAQKDLSGPVPLRAGLVAGAKQVVRGFVDDVERVRLELTIALGAESPRDEVEIDATPRVRAVIQGGIAGELATAWAVVNAVPAVVEREGLLTVLDLPAGR